MPYNETLADRIREALADEAKVEEKAMFGSLCFLVDDKMFACVRTDFSMWRVGEQQAGVLVEESGVEHMMNGKRRMKDFVYVDNDTIRGARELHRWIGLAKAYNALARPARSRRKQS